MAIRDLHDLHCTAVDASTAKAAKYSHTTRQTINQGRATQISHQKAWLLVDARERDLMSLATENTILISFIHHIYYNSNQNNSRQKNRISVQYVKHILCEAL